MKRVIPAGKFKTVCLKVMDEVQSTKTSVTITKRNKPVAKLVPIEEESQFLFGKMKGTLHIKGDIMEPIGEEWDACS